MTTRADLFNRYNEFAAKFGVDAARHVVAWRGYCASADVRRVVPGVYNSLVQSFDDIESGKERLPRYRPSFDQPRPRASRLFDRRSLFPWL
ncbi:hypothetical protein I6F36_21180 [Bradyrhizobium sp. BRP19]|uniref:hypothetical protein n=1 Tax=Bradyrhizobium sp. BRP19 TaxID=2793823 RepID=UPI001CD4ABB8|nr:hypothetical protein [Bradyrhizobium sp. BRP19]MCA1549347.1 hypothetical protein [Bradyrhizobium sp. BRP19]